MEQVLSTLHMAVSSLIIAIEENQPDLAKLILGKIQKLFIDDIIIP
jgi:hypothetical protein